jgi:hypothetical protein
VNFVTVTIAKVKDVRRDRFGYSKLIVWLVIKMRGKLY